ncbi:MAG: hypothetical protein GY795_50660 [Desulfobacterales bacterium]|nr:hypothetical protein [Desulfobacterales bacterium]
MHIIAIIEILAQIYFISHAIKTDKPRYWIIILLIPWAGFTAYFFTEFLPEILQNQAAGDAIEHTGKSDQPANHKLAYITQGKLFHKSDSAPLKQIQSHFGQNLVDRAVRIHQKNEWKTKGAGSHFGGSALWGVDDADTDAIRVFVTSVTRSREKERLYFILESETVGGLFTYNYATDEENRLFHRNNFYAKDLDLNLETEQLVCSQMFPDGTSNIVMMNGDGSELRGITEGDSVDEAPSWIPGNQRRILFQSSGIARNKEGYIVGTGAASIQAIDLDNDRLTGVLEDNKYDFLQPRISPDGYLYYIRRPYEVSRYNDKTAIFDFFLLPFRLLRALFHYLNFFSLVYSQKPLTTASGPKTKGDDIKTIMLKGKIIDAEKALRKGTKIMGVPSLVPPSWELVRRSQDSSEKVVARNVAAFDISSDGTVAYSNGCGIFSLDSHGVSRLILKDNIIEEIIVD